MKILEALPTLGMRVGLAIDAAGEICKFESLRLETSKPKISYVSELAGLSGVIVIHI